MPFRDTLRELSKGNSRAQILKLVAQLPIYIKLLWGLSKDQRVPVHAKGLLVAALAYLLSPIDLIPDFIPILGQIDDVAVFLMVWRIFRSQCPSEVWEEHLHRIKLGESDFDRDLSWLRDHASNLVAYVERNLDRLLERYGKGGGARP